jgi:hypothetical protein
MFLFDGACCVSLGGFLPLLVAFLGWVASLISFYIDILNAVCVCFLTFYSLDTILLIIV